MIFSRYLAVIAGVALPVLETVRRWHQLGNLAIWPAWLDDWCIGIFLLYGAWRASRDAVTGRPILAAAWGFACGMGYASLFSQLAALGEADPSGLASTTMVAIKGMMLALGIAALVATSRQAPAAIATVIVALTSIGCAGTRRDPEQPSARYIVTAAPIDIGIGSGRFCIAVDPADPAGVWWWEPGKDCSTRSTGPGVFHAERPSVSPSADAGATDVRFRVQLIRAPDSPEPPFVDVVLRLRGNQLQVVGTSRAVATTTRNDLEVPDAWR